MTFLARRRVSASSITLASLTSRVGRTLLSAVFDVGLCRSSDSDEPCKTGIRCVNTATLSIEAVRRKVAKGHTPDRRR